MSFAPGRLSIGICDRCKTKRAYQDLVPDGDRPGLRVCRPGVGDCRDQKDPWKKPPKQPEAVAVRFPRPDSDISIPGGAPEITGG